MDHQQIYETCPIHPKQFLQVVCLECETNSIACPLCIDLSHKNHLMISLKKFLSSELPKLYSKKPDHKLLTKGINDLASTYQGLFQKMRKLIGHELNELQKLYQSQIEALHKENDLVCGMGDKLYTMQNVSLLKKKIKNGEKIPEMKVFNAKIGELSQKINPRHLRNYKRFDQFLVSQQIITPKFQALVQSNSQLKQFSFSNSLKHKGLVVQINNWRGRKVINELYDNSYHIAVVEPPLNPFKNQIRFRVQKSQNKCVWIGVCDLKKIIDKRFSNCYKKGQGAYWIWQAGCQGGAQYFSSILNDSQNLPWNFQVGDVIKIRLIYEKDNRYAQFQKNGHKIFRGKLDKANVYCACVAMGAQNQSVVIMQD